VSIKARLTIAFVALLIGAAAVIGWAVVRTTRASLVDQLDNRLLAQGDRPFGPVEPDRPGGTAETEDRYRSIAEIFVPTHGGQGIAVPAGFPGDEDPLPELPPVPSEEIDDLVGRIVTLPAEEGDLDYRVLVREQRGYYRILATPLSGVDDAVGDLVRTILITAGVVVAVGAVTAWLIVRRGLRPVDRMVDTASAIAGGDLSQRIEHDEDDRSELGRLASALDDMLGQLEEAFAEREESQAQLRQFVADASHELRTPVTAIRGYAELYRRGGLSDEVALDRAMTRIESESERMGRLVEDLLLLARLDQQQPLDVAAVDLTQLATDAVSDLRAVETDRPVTLEAATPIVVEGDERRLRQVLANLLTNARVHTPERTPVHVTVGSDDGRARLVVADEGPGIEPAIRSRVFERFYRADPSRSRARGGAGLGLSIVESVVSAHGGRLEVDERPGGGTRFTVWLPQSRDGAAPSD
jgi:two-component system OmpR family sensor kinase